MYITVNGQTQKINGETTLSQLLATLNLDPERVAVERNLEVVAKSDFDTTTLTTGDTLEIVQFVGGG
jgi:thiazole synthase